MTDVLNSNGLQVSNNNELVEQLTTDFQTIYGNDISVEQNSPDGQMINIFAQGGTDIRELLVQLYNSFDPDNCSGRLLDERCALNNIFRKAGTFTTVYITIVTDRTVSLQGVDDKYNDPNATGFTIQDNAGNQFVLVNSQTLAAGTHSVLFRAKEIGAVETTIGTITTPVTIVLGVVSVNNPTAATTGENEETDAELKIRRRQSVSIASSGYINGILASVLQLDGVTDAAIYENYTGTTDANGTPAHCMWLVVEGGSAADIADVIYKKKPVGTNMRGNVTYSITTVSGYTFVAAWDEPTVQSLYVKFDIQPTISPVTFDDDAIKGFILDNINYRIGDGAETSTLTTLAQAAIDANGGNGVAVNVLISTGGSSSVTVSGLDSASVDNVVFQSAVSDTAGTYVFSYDGADWSLGGDTVDLEDYGITFEGDADNGDTITVVWTASSWVEYIAPVVATKLAITDIDITVL